MKAVLICPADRPSVASLAESAPLVRLPILGKSLIEYWLEHLVNLGAKHVLVLCTDRPEQVRALIGDGARWGLQVEVLPEIRELTPDEARAKYRGDDAGGWLANPNDVVLADRLPGLPQCPLFAGYAEWFAGVVDWMPRAISPDRVGVRELQPGITVGLHTRVSSQAILRPPCWLGSHVCVGAQAVIGPRAILEDRVLVGAAAEISDSVVGPETYVGELTELRNSLAWGSRLINWREGASVLVPDAFLLSALDQRHAAPRRVSWLGRLLALGVLAATLPIGLWLILRSKWRGQPGLRFRTAVRPQSPAAPAARETLAYGELASVHGWWRRWPQLWSVARGQFAWVGNRPLSSAQAEALSNDFERLWLATPIGLISLADVEACVESFGDDARAHSSFYAAQACWRLDMSILVRALFQGLFRTASAQAWEPSPLPVAHPFLNEKI